MELDFILKIAGIGLIVALLNQVLTKSGRDEYAMLTVIAGVAVVLFILLPKLSELLETLKNAFEL